MKRWVAVGLLVAATVAAGGGPAGAGEDAPRRAKNVVLVIGDGFGAAQVAFGVAYARLVQGRTLHIERIMERGDTGYALPLAHEAVVTDSAAAASQIATGRPARNETIGLDAEGFPAETLVEWAERRGLATGVVSNMRITHATPAAFASHQISRYVPEAAIADDLVDGPVIDVVLGGGARAFVPRGETVSASLPGIPAGLDGTSVRPDDRSLLAELRERGYRIPSNRAELAEAARSASRLFGLFAASHLPYVVDRDERGAQAAPSLVDLTRAALDVLSRSEAGFFLMIEAGRIDYAGHDNDAGTMLQEILELDEAVGLLLDFQRESPDTLVIVTADHGTGGIAFSYRTPVAPTETALASGRIYRPRWSYPGAEQLRRLGEQKASYELILERAGTDIARLREEVLQATGYELNWAEASRVLARNELGHAEPCEFKDFYTDPEDASQCLLGRALARQTFVVWSTGGHTTDPVLTFGLGPGSEGLRGIYPNTHIHDVVRAALEP